MPPEAHCAHDGAGEGLAGGKAEEEQCLLPMAENQEQKHCQGQEDHHIWCTQG